MTTFKAITTIIAEILDLDPQTITPSTYLIRELGAESIDLLEIGVAIQHRLGVPVDDDILFLKNLRVLILQAKQDSTNPLMLLTQTYAHLDAGRLGQILDETKAGPVLQVRDLVAYVKAQS